MYALTFFFFCFSYTGAFLCWTHLLFFFVCICVLCFLSTDVFVTCKSVFYRIQERFFFFHILHFLQYNSAYAAILLPYFSMPHNYFDSILPHVIFTRSNDKYVLFDTIYTYYLLRPPFVYSLV